MSRANKKAKLDVQTTDAVKGIRVVDEILAKRVNNGEIEYYLSWKDTSEQHSWEPSRNLDCRELIEKFESLIRDEGSGVMSAYQKDLQSNEEAERLNVFQNPKEIIGAEYNVDKQLQFLISWKDGVGNTLVSSDIASLKWPQLVIKFYEDRLSLEEDPDNDTLVLKGQKDYFPPGHVPEKIIGVVKIREELYFLIKWKNREDGNFMPSSIINVNYPEVVIKYYEERLGFPDT